jgi:2-C-methyl-D-erythritol 4-phosphate cytidylyltransferase/2-C-methyl-D-erythritol 2,4-cyclodiphosphate synthase
LAHAPSTAALIVAAGRGTRVDNGGIPKQYQPVGGKSVLARSLAPFLANPAIDVVQVVIGEADQALYDAAVAAHGKLLPPVTGAASRQGSVRAGLAALAARSPKRVLIHDAARPFASAALLDRVLTGLEESDAVVPTLPVADTLKRVADGAVIETVPRADLAAAATPQGFAFAAIHAAHEKAAGETSEFTDDAAVAEWAGLRVGTVTGDPQNVKLTTAADVAAADRRLRMEDALRLGDVRVGFGYDVHPLGPGSEIILAGVAIPHTRGLVGHSDADVMLHALTDAVLGALGDGDIGVHFPPSEARWKDAPSDQFLADAVARVAARGGIVAHLDVAYVGEGPKISPHRDTMRARIAEIAGIGIDRVGLKATTHEALGFIGRGEGVAAHAVATIRLPFDET